MSVAGAKDAEQVAVRAAATNLLPNAALTAWQRRFVKFAWDDLNGLFDRLVVAASEKAPCPLDLRNRIHSTVGALSWSSEALIGQLWTLIGEGLERPEDAFAPALILRRLAPEDPKARQWLTAQTPKVSTIIEYLQR